MLHTEFRQNRSIGSKEEDFRDKHHFNKFSFLGARKLTYKIWLKMAQ